MRARAGVLIVAALLALLCVGVTSLGAALALRQPAVETLETSTRSRLAADYSADPRDIRVPPLNPRIIEDSRNDAQDLASTPSSLTLVPVAGATNTPAAGSSATATPRSETTPSGATPSADQTRVAGSPEPTQSASTATPRPQASPTPTPVNDGGKTVTPTATPAKSDTATPLPVATATATPAEKFTATPTRTPTPAAVPTRTPLPAATLSISPADQTVTLGSATVAINVEHAVDLASFDITIAWNPLILSYGKATVGVFAGGATCQPASVNAVSGTLRLRCSTTGAAGATGSGTLATVQFSMLAPGTSAISFLSATLTTTQGVAQPVVTKGGSITYKLLGLLP